MKILLIGTGYVGTALLSSWTAPIDSFTATTTTQARLQEISEKTEGVRPMLLKLEENSDISTLLHTYDVLIITVAPSRNSSYRQTYFESSESIKKSLAKRNKPLYVLYTSSTSVYGNQEGQLVDEKSMRKPSTANSHLLCEVEDKYLSLPNQYITLCILRLGGIYGPGRTLEDRALRMSGRELPGTGEEPTNHSPLDDITRAIEYCVNRQLSGTYNLVIDEHPTRRTLYEQICKHLKVAPPKWNPSQGRSRSTNALVSNEKIKRAGFAFKHHL